MTRADGYTHQDFPTTYGDVWCGEFREKNEARHD